MIEVVVLNIEKVEQAFVKFPQIANDELRAAAGAAFLGLLDPLTDYPPARKGSSYVRTGDLGRMWTVAANNPQFTPMIGGWTGWMGNARPGIEWVQGEAQAKVHAGRWRKASAIVKTEEPAIQGQFAQAADRIAARIDQEAS